MNFLKFYFGSLLRFSPIFFTYFCILFDLVLLVRSKKVVPILHPGLKQLNVQQMHQK